MCNIYYIVCARQVSRLMNVVHEYKSSRLSSVRSSITSRRNVCSSASTHNRTTGDGELFTVYVIIIIIILMVTQ